MTGARRSAAGALALLAACAGCGEPRESKPAGDGLETVEISAAPDAALTIEMDEQERRAAPAALAGALPDGFPADVPIHRPASLVDLEESDTTVIARFDAPAERGAVAAGLASRLRAGGWRDAGGGVWTRGERRIRLTVEPLPSGSRFSIEYPRPRQ